MKTYGGKVFFLNRENINTDEIIPAKYLTVIDKDPLKSHLLEDLKIDAFDPAQVQWTQYGVIVSRANFGCGSSREMAVWAFEVNGINVIIAPNFARIFRENAFNGGVLAIEMADSIIEDLFSTAKSCTELNLKVDLEAMKLIFTGTNLKKEISFTLSPFERDLIKAGGWVELSAQKY